MSKPWGKIGAWAAEAEREEAEEKEAAAATTAFALPEPESFPSLREAVTAKPKKKKITLKLNEFHSAGLTQDEMIRLPTGPKERSADELQHGRLGGGFTSYGRSGGPPNRRDDGDGSWGGGGGRRPYGGGFDDEGRGPPSRSSDLDQPSRADEADNWATAKKFVPSLDSNRSNRYSSLGGGGSRADDVDNWGSGKKPQPVAAPPRQSNFGSGFRDSGGVNEGWSRGEVPSERPRLVLAPRKENPSSGGSEPVKTNKSNPFGAARPREEILAEKGFDYKKLDLEIEAKTTSSRPTSSHSSRPSSAQSSRSENVDGAMKPRPRVNPFGDAKPREVLLEQKGVNWRKIDLELEHSRIGRPETEQEKILKEEIDSLKTELAAETNGEPLDQSSTRSSLLSQKERELELLACDLDDKVRFEQKATDRPASRSGSVSSLSERPNSRSGSFDENDHPPPRGTGSDARTRPNNSTNNEGRAFQGGRERGYFQNRDIDRSRPRW